MYYLLTTYSMLLDFLNLQKVGIFSDGGNRKILLSCGHLQSRVITVPFSEEYRLIPLPSLHRRQDTETCEGKGITFTDVDHHGRPLTLEGIVNGHK